jgi:hypothetical protein
MGSYEFIDVAVRSNGRLEKVTRRVCSTLGVGEGEATEGAYEAYHWHVEWDGEQCDGAGG